MLQKQANDGILDALTLNDLRMSLKRNGQKQEQWALMVSEAGGRNNFKKERSESTIKRS